MKFLKTLAPFLVLLSQACGKSTTAGKFEKYHQKPAGPLQLNDAAYDELTAAPRDYTIAVLLTALEARYGCELCRQFQPEWDLIGKSWNKADKRGELRVLYGTLDFSEGKNTFQKVKQEPTCRYF